MDAQSSQTASAGDLRDSDVYPVHRLDAWKTNYVFVAWIMRFNDVLDVEKLYSSLSELLEQGDWRKLGGRLKTTVSPSVGARWTASNSPRPMEGWNFMCPESLPQTSRQSHSAKWTTLP